MKPTILQIGSPLRILGLTAALLAGCGDGGGTTTGPSTTQPSDRFILSFDSRLDTQVRVSRITVTTKSHVQGQVALASTPQPNQFSTSQGDLTYESFAYAASPSGGCSFTTSTSNGVLTVVEASVSPANADAVRVVLRPSNAVREQIVQSCSTTSVTIPGIYWYGAWQILHAAEGSLADEAWILSDWTAGSGDVVAEKKYERTLPDPSTGVTYREVTTIQIRRA